jgi:CBS domain-containing protein
VRAQDLIVEQPTVGLSDPAVEAARVIGSQHRPAVVVVDDGGRPVTVLPASQVLRFLVPGYIQEDPSLVAVYDERAADELAGKLAGRTVGDLVPRGDRQKLPVVDPDATILECAAVMASLRSPVLVVREGDRTLGVVTASRLLEALFG